METTLESVKQFPKKAWAYLKKDTWDSWLVSLILMIVLIKFIFFPGLSFVTGANPPLWVVESCSMYHEASFDNWWTSNEVYYENFNITKSEFQSFSLKNGLNKGDIILIIKQKQYNPGDIIIFDAGAQSPTGHPIIHRLISEIPLETKGDHNTQQLSFEKNIPQDKIIGRVFPVKLPLLGWAKLIFFEPFRPESERGLCH